MSAPNATLQQILLDDGTPPARLDIATNVDHVMQPCSLESNSVNDGLLDRAGKLSLLVELIDGTRRDISPMTARELSELQFVQETAFARAIIESPKGSEVRAERTRVGYTTICRILERMGEVQGDESELVMGMDQRYTQLVLTLLSRMATSGRVGGLFEIGFSTGTLLAAVANHGYLVGGIEVVDRLLEATRCKLSQEHHSRLLLGSLREVDLSAHFGRYSVVYWNDVFEHIPTDEILEFLKLVPTVVSRHRVYDVPMLWLTGLKLWAEPWLESLPYRVAVQACRRFGLNCTIATR